MSNVTLTIGLATTLILIGLSQLSQHNFEHNRMASNSSIIRIFVQSTLCTQEFGSAYEILNLGESISDRFVTYVMNTMFEVIH